MKNIKLLGSAMLVSLALFSQSSLAKEYKIGASLLTQQHPFYIDLANAMKEEAKKDNVNLSVSIANQDLGNDSNLLIVFYVQIMPDDFVMQLHRF
ncbi:ribose ABC transporter [Escherichia coli]|nr:ribose ABC transporter [Escherichia coli]